MQWTAKYKHFNFFKCLSLHATLGTAMIFICLLHYLCTSGKVSLNNFTFSRLDINTY